jgi:hypothetical protein
MKISSLHNTRPNETHYYICSHPNVEHYVRVIAPDKHSAIVKFAKHSKLSPEDVSKVKIHRQDPVDLKVDVVDGTEETALQRAEKEATKKSKRGWRGWRRRHYQDINESTAVLEAIKRLIK